MVSALIVTHYYREREANITHIVELARPAVDMVVVASNNPPPPSLPGVAWLGSSANFGTRLRLFAALAHGVDVAVFVDDDVALPPATIDMLAATASECGVVGLWGAPGLLNGRACAATRGAILRCVQLLPLLPTMWCDDILLGCCGTELRKVVGDHELLSPCDRSLEYERQGYVGDRRDTIAALLDAGLLSDWVEVA